MLRFFFTGRQFQAKWLKKFPWLTYDEEIQAAFCSTCKSAVEYQLPLPHDLHSLRSKTSFVTDGFSSWRKALEVFQTHEKSKLHREAVNGLSNMKKNTVVHALSDAKAKQMKDARVALLKIFHTVRVLAEEGIPYRGHTDENSKFMSLLKMRAPDVPELKVWLDRTSYKWIHHKNIDEMLDLLLKEVLLKLIEPIRKATCFSIMMDECSDIRRLEQVSIVIRHVDDALQIHEDFLGFYETNNTRSETLFKIITDVLERFNLPIRSIVGQCFDGAANMSGELTGLKTRMQEVNPKALFVHCTAHRLNLVVQDALSNIFEVRDFIGTVKELINFVRDSPNRLACFSDLQASAESIEYQSLPSLKAYCPTRWCVRVSSLITVQRNYSTLMDFFNTVQDDLRVDSTVTSKAVSFLRKMESFSFYFYLHTVIDIFEKIEILNRELQAEQLNFGESNKKISTMKNLIACSRDKFSEIWEAVNAETTRLELNEPILPRIRKAPKRYESSSSPHNFGIEEYYRKKYYEIIDSVSMALNQRFNDNDQSFLKRLEEFVIGKVSDSKEVATEIITFYEEEFRGIADADRIILHRDMTLDLMKNLNLSLKPKCIHDIVKFFLKSENMSSLSFVLSIKVLLQIFLTIPVSTCTCERSFSAMRRLKTYLRSMLTAQHLNQISVLHVHKQITRNIDLEKLMNEWICRKTHRSSTFYLESNTR